MNNKVKKEIEQLIKELKLNCTVEKFKDKVRWINISGYQELSEDFIREFQDKVDWIHISYFQKLSEDFIREFKNEVSWTNISRTQKLSEDYIREFKDKINWRDISRHQKLSEDFIREFKDKISWMNICRYQKLSEKFIIEFKDKVDWYNISECQTLSKKFLNEFKDKLDITLYNEVHQTKTKRQKEKEIKEYAKKHNLKFDGEFLYTFRNHDQFGRGIFNKTISYKKGKYYKDWHCDIRKEEEDSFGLGIWPKGNPPVGLDIWPKGNTPVKIKVEDWGLEVNREDGKARVWGFEII